RDRPGHPADGDRPGRHQDKGKLARTVAAWTRPPAGTGPPGLPNIGHVPHLLHLDSAAALKGSRSRELTATFADTWRARGPEFTVTYRDLHRDPLPHLADAVLHWPPRLRPEGAAWVGPAVLAAAEAQQDELVAELPAADVVL